MAAAAILLAARATIHIEAGEPSTVAHDNVSNMVAGFGCGMRRNTCHERGRQRVSSSINLGVRAGWRETRRCVGGALMGGGGTRIKDGARRRGTQRGAIYASLIYGCATALIFRSSRQS